MADPSRPDLRVVAAYLDEVDVELDAVKRLAADPPNRLAAFHLQQGAEKLVKAVRLIRGLRVTADHNLEALVQELPAGDPWQAKLRAIEPLSAYATTYRYPSPAGRRKDGPGKEQVLTWAQAIAELNAEARATFLKPSS
jgi:HEPN domain-containing protein